MSAASETPADPAGEESPKERVDRELDELLSELRVLLPGVQVLFAFLLTVPFTNRFAEIRDLPRAVYFAAFLLTGAAAACLIAPTTYHRLRFRQYDKEVMLRYANALTLTAASLLALAMSAVAYVITDVLFTDRWAAVTAVLAMVLFVSLWFVFPIARRVVAGEGAPSVSSARDRAR